MSKRKADAMIRVRVTKTGRLIATHLFTTSVLLDIDPSELPPVGRERHLWLLRRFRDDAARQWPLSVRDTEFWNGATRSADEIERKIGPALAKWEARYASAA